MFNNPADQIANLYGSDEIVPGTPVYDIDGSKVGEVTRYDMQGGYLDIKKGLIFTRDVYIPLSAIGQRTTDGIYLNMPKDELRNQNWDTPPSETQPLDTGMVNRDRTAAMNTPSGLGTNQAPLNTAGNQYDTGSHHPTPVGDGDVAVPVREEELIARKQQQEAGRVHINKDVVEEQQTLNVPVTREEVRVEHVPVQGQSGDIGPDAFQERDIDVPVMGEQVTAEKRAKVNEEIHLHKRAVTENQQVSDTVRKERVNVEGVDNQGNVPLDASEQDTLTNNP
ncbi:MAG TPA: PRC and DUF2382 domain-containing protein [Ktedonobacterales bacterium]|nr:PRC and DUF2382 domain-containing protein [Ktedonobacterales bacterium]